MATAPEEDAAVEQVQLTPQDEDYNPFTEEDIQKILHEEQTNSAEEGWSFVKRNNFGEIWRKNERDKPVHLIKGYLNFPGIPAEQVVEMIHNLEVRKEWDKQFPVIDVLEQKKHYRVVYWLVKMPPLVADRDIVQYIGHRYDENTNTTYLLYRNTTHPDRPERKGIVRGETILSGVIIRPDPEDPYNSSKMSIMLQNDIKGWVPHFVVNAFAARAPLEWRESLANYYTSIYSKKTEEDAGEGSAPEGQSADANADNGQSAATEGGDEGTEVEGQGASSKAEDDGGETKGEAEAVVEAEETPEGGGEGEGGEQEEAVAESKTEEGDKAEAPTEE